MRNALVILALVACSGKKNDGSADQKAVDKPAIKCPAGQVDNAGTCVAVVTPDKIAAVAQQQSRIDELGKLLDQIDVVEAPIEILNGLRQVDAWKAFAAGNDKAKMADQLVDTANHAVKALRDFKANLGEVSARVGNIKGELDKLMTDTGAGKKLEEVRAQISAQVKAAIEPYAAQTSATIQSALVPLTEKLDDVSAIVDIACGTVKLSGGDKAKALCKDAKATFDKGMKYLEDLKARPATLFDDVTKTLETQLDQLIDAQTKQLLDTAQTKVNEALKLPPKP